MASPVMKAGTQTQLSEQPIKMQSGETAPMCRLIQVRSLTPFRLLLMQISSFRCNRQNWNKYLGPCEQGAFFAF